MRQNTPRPTPLRGGLVAHALLLLALAMNAAGEARAQTSATTQWQLALENDRWGDGADGHYTHGTRISRRSTDPAPWVERTAARLRCRLCRDLDAVEWTVGQDLYTPEATWRPDPVADDRPYAGWLYGGVRLLAGEQGTRAYRLDSLGLDVGIVGPAALGEQTQSLIHGALAKPISQGWDHQLQDELGVVLRLQRAWHHAKRIGRWTSDVAPYVSAALGNVFTHFGAGLTIKTGVNFQRHRLAQRHPGTGWHLFLDLETRAVARNLFLDGNTLASSHRVEKALAIGEMRGGLSFTLGPLGVTLAAAVRSREFVGQRRPDRYGGVIFSFQP